jgi:Domain of unknown function (DUF4912)
MTRDDLELLDTKRLRELAKERFAKKARTLRTRGALLAALTRSLPVAVPPAEPRRKAKKQSRAAVGPLPTSATPARPSAPALPGPLLLAVQAGSGDALVEEGFFLGPQPRRKAPRRPEASPSAEAEVRPPEAPARPLLDEDVPHLLARDATTLFLFWDIRRPLERGAAFGLHAPRVRFRLYDAEAWVRTVEAPLGRQSLYLEGLEPGHLYSVEAWLAGSDGHERPTGQRSAAVRLAPAVPSARLDVRQVHVPWEQPLAAWRGGAASGFPPDAERLEPPERLELPASLEWRGGVGPLGPSSGRP